MREIGEQQYVMRAYMMNINETQSYGITSIVYSTMKIILYKQLLIKQSN